MRRHTCADGSFEWYVLNGHTRRRASRTYPTRAAAAAARRKLQLKLDLAKAKVLRASALTRPAAEPAQAFFPALGLLDKERVTLGASTGLGRASSRQQRAGDGPTFQAGQRPDFPRASYGGGGQACRPGAPRNVVCRPTVSERDRQARCILAQPGHRKSPARSGG